MNHASIIDGVRLCKAKRYRYKNNNMADLEKQLQDADAAGERIKVIATDGVFSMDGNVAPLDKIYELASKYDAMVMKFSDIIGNAGLKENLASMVREGRTGHAFLFQEEPGYGAIAFALALAQYLCCPHRTDADSCGECTSCNQMQKLIHPDLHFAFPVNTSTSVPASAKQPVSDMLILYNWSYSLDLDDEDVDAEKPFRSERIKVTDSPERRLAVKSATAAFPGGAFSRQNPDTQLSDLQKFTSKRLRNYYYKWFTPDKQAIVVCGDIDQAKVENYINTLFSTIPKPVETPSLLYATIPPKDTVQFLILTDPKLQYCEVSLTMQAELLNADLRLTGVSLVNDYMLTAFTPLTALSMRRQGRSRSATIRASSQA